MYQVKIRFKSGETQVNKGFASYDNARYCVHCVYYLGNVSKVTITDADGKTVEEFTK